MPNVSIGARWMAAEKAGSIERNTSNASVDNNAGLGQHNTADAAAALDKTTTTEATTMMLMWIFALISNSMVCLVIRRSKRMQSTTNFFVVSLAISDLALLITFCPFTLLWLLNDHTWTLSGVMCRLVRLLQHATPVCCTFTLVCIAVDRFYTIIYPLTFKVTKTTAKQLIVISCVLALIVAMPSVHFHHVIQAGDNGLPRTCTLFLSPQVAGSLIYASLLLFIGYVCPSCILLTSYRRLFVHIWRLGFVFGHVLQRTANPVPRPKVKTIRMLLWLTTIYILLVGPFFICQVWHASLAFLPRDVAMANSMQTAHVLSMWLLLMAASAKPVVYLFLNGNFRRGCREVLCMSKMKCYRQDAYAITNSASFAHLNHVGAVDVSIPRADNTDNYNFYYANGTFPTVRMESPSQTFNRNAKSNAFWPRYPRHKNFIVPLTSI